MRRISSNGSNGLSSNMLRDSKWQVRLSRAICPRTGKVGPKRTFIPTPSAALQLLQTGHSLRVLDFFSV